jgi:hypothetical protein
VETSSTILVNSHPYQYVHFLLITYKYKGKTGIFCILRDGLLVDYLRGKSQYLTNSTAEWLVQKSELTDRPTTGSYIRLSVEDTSDIKVGTRV